ncbi:hypothetical protein ACFC1L_40120 [Streptomyces sp. NPDC056210]|uniref:hypothetical protein n=1 Tax=Streptomyces sp. NPDC056210 TaxID=3345746 RepID=UPI0035D55B4F
MQKRLDDLERRPAPTSLYDTYPCVEWAAIGRGKVGDNVWSSCGIANVTGMKFDRVEAKFTTNKILATRSEAEIRIAAFKHSHNTQYKVCVAASTTVRLTGNWGATIDVGAIGMGKWRWIHGLPIGWNVDTDDQDSIYTIELQHRNPDDCLQTPEDPEQAFVWLKRKSATPDSKFGIKGVAGTPPLWVIGQADGGAQPVGWRDIGSLWDGSYQVSTMHYCAGMSAEQLPEATESGWFWYSGGDAEYVRQPDINERYMAV